MFQNPPSRVGETVGQHALPVLPTAPSPHALEKQKTLLLTLLLHNHHDHFNILLPNLRLGKQDPLLVAQLQHLARTEAW